MNVLIISPFFPPFSTVGAVRMASLSRFLINKGCNVTVLRNNTEGINDSEKKMDIPKDIEIFEVNSFTETSYFKNFFEGYKSYENLLSEVISQKVYDAVIISGGPFYTFTLTKILKKRYGIKCILDFRDLWIFEAICDSDSVSLKMFLSKIISYPLERMAIKYADGVVLVTESWKRKMMSAYPKYKNKMKLISNGYDDSILQNVKNIEENNTKFTLGVYGKLSSYSRNYTIELFKAIRTMRNNNINIGLVQGGSLEDSTKKIIKELNITSEEFTCTGFLDYINGMKMMSTVNACILVDKRKAALGTKVYDYIYLNKPIIYVGLGKTDLSEFIGGFEYGYICENSEGITSAVDNILKNKITLLAEDNESKKYSRSIQNEKYYKYIKNL